ncbi:hypothetical protein SDRG_08653 [Saprolegnia diclina VS20]|uniref:Thioredoxin domain-containing protein n=1 Tax=Saprolegnia diclina (strain VS20) TaxID=1156394 RepID=T0Q805_SAPDV|nr:hypothetical protein SDRG_08653 [Saprolegnia diclina VS20]EQC33974.1 hypothetical protein SDRG_08653 [Saprolegnia diclina VS20]|eukprot:XP_008612769.1 hypothetical protein SDRG_08653 [Saprolegnia diclina VS20]
MGVQEVFGNSDWDAKHRAAGGKLVVADFTASWCGPCQMIKPRFHAMADQYTDVVFLEVNEANNDDLIHSIGIRGFPTFHFYINKQKVDEMVGADPNTLQSKIEQWRASAGPNPFASEGVSLGGGGVALDPREARLRKFNQVDLLPTAPTPFSAPTPVAAPAPIAAPAALTAEQQAEDAELAQALALSQQELSQAQANVDESSAPAEMELPPVNEAFLAQLVEMGFPELRARKALLATNDGNLDQCINWIDEHQDDADIDAPIQYIDMAHHKRTLTADEKEAAKVEELKQRIELKRKEREEAAKKDDVAREIARRNMGKEANAAKEEYEAIQTRLLREKQRKEKLDAKLERERLLKQLEMDKAERRAHGGVLKKAAFESDVVMAVSAPSPPKPSSGDTSHLSPSEQMRQAVDRLMQYRVGGDGLTALKTLQIYVRNVLEKPAEFEKYSKINGGNAAFKKRVGSLLGGLAFLRAVGFVKTDTDELVMTSRDEALLQEAMQQLSAAIARY